MENKIIFLFLISFFIKTNAQNTNCDKRKRSEAQTLYIYNCDHTKSLIYTLDICQHYSKHPSIIEIKKSQAWDTTELKGYLKTDIGYFEKSKDELTSVNFQKDTVTYTTENEEKKITSLYWEKWYGSMRFNFYANSEPKITFDGTCKPIENEKKQWGNWQILWENKNDSVQLLYRILYFFDEGSKTEKTKIQIKGPENYISGEFSFLGKITLSFGSKNKVIGYSVTQTNILSNEIVIDIPKIEKIENIFTGKFYRKHKLKKIKMKEGTAMGTRG